MNATHWHLMLNHFPVLGSVFGLALLAAGMWRNSEDLKKASLLFFAVAATLALPVYFTGEPAVKSVKFLPGTSQPLIERHAETAQFALAGVLLLGTVSVLGLVRFRRGKLMPGWWIALLLALALAVGGLMLWTANFGGRVRHTEIYLTDQ